MALEQSGRLMVDHSARRVYVDNSILSAHRACRERARLRCTIGYRPVVQRPALAFGHAFHAAVAAYYDALAGGYFDEGRQWHRFAEGHDTPAVLIAQAAFLRDLKIEGNTLPVTLESAERRSIERGLALVDAYITRWKDEPYVSCLDKRGAPLTEVGFQFYLTSLEGYDIYYVGVIDRIMLNLSTTRPVLFETKHTTQALSQYIKRCKPNHQITGYFKGARFHGVGIDPDRLVFPGIRECVWDISYLSDRQPNISKSMGSDPLARFWAYGIDARNDFDRQTTMRSTTDIEEFTIDAEADAIDYVKWLLSGTRRWPRVAGDACHAYGGCEFRDRCAMNFEDEDEAARWMSERFIIKPWNPLERMVHGGD